MKKILLLIPALNAGGAERVMVTLANEWSKENDVTILIFHNSESFYELSPKVKLVKMGLSLPAGGIKRIISIPMIELKRYHTIKKTITNGNYDFVLSFTRVTNLFTCILSGKLPNEYLIISERSDPDNYSSLMKFAIGKLYRKCDLVVCQNKVVKNFFEKRNFRNDLTILPNPVNFRDIPNERPKQREHVISTAGRLTWEKNHKLLLEAFSEVHKNYPEYKLRIYGDGPLENELKQYAASIGISDHVEWMGARKKVMFEINLTEIFVLCSVFEGFPNALIEAMATQMPVVSSNFATGVANELIQNGDNGFVFECGDKQGLADAIMGLIKMKDRHDEIGRKNRGIALQYKGDAIANKWLSTIIDFKTRKKSPV